MREAILAAVFEWYQQDYLTWRDENGYDEEEAARYLPKLAEPTQLAGLIQLTAINVFPAAKNGLSYTGYEFVCSWEEKHGLGAMLHDRRVVEVSKWGRHGHPGMDSRPRRRRAGVTKLH